MLGQLVGLPSMQKTFERLGYGEPLTTGFGGLGGTTRPMPEAIDTAMSLVPLASATKGLPIGTSIKPTYAPKFDAVKIFESPKAQTVYHATNSSAPVISTNPDRLIPNSLSAAHNKDYLWGSNMFAIRIPAGTRMGEIANVFDVLPTGVEDSPINVGKDRKSTRLNSSH